MRPGYPPWGNDMDWNIQADVNSAKTVIENSQPTLIPLSVVETALRRAHLPALRRAGPLAQLIARQAEAFAVEYDNETVYGRTCPGLPDDIINWQRSVCVQRCARLAGGCGDQRVPLRLDIEDGWLYERVDRRAAGLAVTGVDGARFKGSRGWKW